MGIFYLERVANYNLKILYYCINCSNGSAFECPFSIIKNHYENVASQLKLGIDMRVIELATEKSLDRRLLVREFQTKFNMSPKSFIQKVKIDLALDMLADKKIINILIAENLGMDYEQPLYHAFRKYLGLTPGQVKKRLNQASKPEIEISNLKLILWTKS